MLIVLLFMGLIALIDAPPLLRQRRWWEFASFASLWSVALALALLRALTFSLPAPAEIIVDVVRRLERAVLGGG